MKSLSNLGSLPAQDPCQSKIPVIPRSQSTQDPSQPKIPVNPRSQSAQDPSQHWMPSCLFGIWLMLLYLAHVKSASTKFFKYMLHTHLDFSHAYLAFPSLKKRISQVPTVFSFSNFFQFHYYLCINVWEEKTWPSHYIAMYCDGQVFTYQMLDTY